MKAYNFDNLPTTKHALTLYLREAVNLYFPKLVGHPLTVGFIGSKRYLGQCTYADNLIEMNIKISCPKQFLSTALHELTHLELGGEAGHNSTFKKRCNEAYEAAGLPLEAAATTKSAVALDRKPYKGRLPKKNRCLAA